jgi:hypothetical protein
MQIPKEYNNIIHECGLHIVYSIELCSAISLIGKRKKQILWHIKFDSVEIMMSNINYIVSETKKQDYNNHKNY